MCDRLEKIFDIQIDAVTARRIKYTYINLKRPYLPEEFPPAMVLFELDRLVKKKEQIIEVTKDFHHLFVVLMLIIIKYQEDWFPSNKAIAQHYEINLKNFNEIELAILEAFNYSMWGDQPLKSLGIKPWKVSEYG